LLKDFRIGSRSLHVRWSTYPKGTLSEWLTSKASQRRLAHLNSTPSPIEKHDQY